MAFFTYFRDMEESGRRHEDDIYISEGKWIHWVDYDASVTDDYDIEDELKEMQPFWNNMMTECVSECCGIHAYDFTKGSVEKAVEKLNKHLVAKQLSKLRDIAANCNNNLISSRTLNHRLKKEVFIKLVNHLQSCL